MAVLTMPRKPTKGRAGSAEGTGSPLAGEPAAGVLSSLKVLQEDQQIVAKIAALRNVSIAVLFTHKDVRTFFRHLLIAETGKEQDRQQQHLEAEHRKDQK